MPNNLTATLTSDQLKQNIDSLQAQKQSNDAIQSYINNYKLDPAGSGNYVLASSLAAPSLNQGAASGNLFGTAGSIFSSLFGKLPPVVQIGVNAAAMSNPITALSALALKYGGSAISGTADAMSSGEQGAGREISAVINQHLPGMQKTQDAAQASTNQLGKVNAMLLQEINKQKAEGKDTSTLEALVQENSGVLQSTGYNANLPAGATDSASQIYGNFGQMALDIVASGELQKAADGTWAGTKGAFSLANDAEKARLAEMGVTDSEKAATLLDKLKKVAVMGMQGAVKGGAVGYGYDVSQNLKGGATGLAAAKPGMGTAWGAGLGAALPLSFAAFGAGKDILSNMASDKSLADVYAMPEADVLKGKLNSEDTTAYFNNQKTTLASKTAEDQAAIDQKLETAKAARGAELEKQVTVAQKNVSDLESKLQTTSQAEARQLQSDIVKTSRKVSNLYVEVSDGEIAAANFKPGTTIAPDALQKNLLSEFSDNPIVGSQQAQRLGIAQEDPALTMMRSLGADVQEPTEANKAYRASMGEGAGATEMTPKELLQKRKQLMQTIPLAERGQRATLSANSMNTLRTIHAIDQTLSDAGLDTSKSDALWTDWKKIQNYSRSTFDIYGGQGPKGIAAAGKELVSKATGTSDLAVASQDFYSKLEGYMGKPVGTETKAASDALAAAQAEFDKLPTDVQAFVNSDKFDEVLKEANARYETETAALDTKNTSDQANLSEKQRTAQQALASKARKIKALKWALSAVGIGASAGAGDALFNFVKGFFGGSTTASTP